MASKKSHQNTEYIAYAKKLIKDDYHNLALMDDVLRDNDEIVSYAISIDPYTLTFASPRLRGNAEMVEFAVTKSSYALMHATDNLKKNAEFVRKMCRIDAIVAGLPLMDDLLHDREFVKNIISDNLMAYIFIAEKVAKDESFLIELVNADMQIVTFTPKKYLTKNVFLVVLPIDGSLLYYGDEMMKADKELALMAISNAPSIFRHLSANLRADEDVVTEIIKKKYFYLLKFAADKFKTPEYIQQAVKFNAYWKYIYELINCS